MDNWRRSSYSGEGDGNNCVEIAGSPHRIAVRDSKAPKRGVLTFRETTFAIFVAGIKEAKAGSGPR
ncbi:DUF397 domain-containing protein [Streptomyces althioticus]|uniref:DUF397 domain-containing protein n=1 Tax=Streptomyces althioticus TaxID=83380 RepID=UPI003701C25B